MTPNKITFILLDNAWQEFGRCNIQIPKIKNWHRNACAPHGALLNPNSKPKSLWVGLVYSLKNMRSVSIFLCFIPYII